MDDGRFYCFYLQGEARRGLPVKMLMPKTNRVAIYEHLFKGE